MPAMSAIKLSAQKIQDVSHLKKIAEAWRECTINRGWVTSGITDCPRVSSLVAQLAGDGKIDPSDAILNDPCVYVSSGDKYASKIRAESIAVLDGGKINGRPGTVIDGYVAWAANASNFLIAHGCLISYVLACNLPSTAPLATTPLAFTRGLREDGKWDEKAGLYGSKGGYVVYCDGHSVWFDGSRPAKFLHWNGQKYTSNIREAIPNSAFLTCGDSFTNTNYKSDGSLVILYHAGTGGN
jgi:hypothetical protein